MRQLLKMNGTQRRSRATRAGTFARVLAET